jgi:cytochrome c553
MRTRLALVLACCCASVALAACGGSGGGGGTSGGPKKQFASLGCASCHTLKAAGATGRVGPDLDELKPDAATVEHQMRTGGGGMPSFDGKLSDAELTSLAAWVATSAGGA